MAAGAGGPPPGRRGGPGRAGRPERPAGRQATTTSSTPTSPPAEVVASDERTAAAEGRSRTAGRPTGSPTPMRAGRGRAGRPGGSLAAGARRRRQPAQAVRAGARPGAGGRAGPGGRRSCCPWSTTSSARWSTPTATRARSSRASGPSATRRVAAARPARLSAPRGDRRAVRPAAARGGQRGAEQRRAPPGTVVQVVRPGYGEDDRQLRPAAVVVAGRQAGVRPRWHATSTRCSGSRGPRRRRDPAGVPQAGPHATTRTSTRIRARRRGSRRSTRRTRCSPTRSTRARYDRFGAGLPPDPGGVRGRPGRSRAAAQRRGGRAVARRRTVAPGATRGRSSQPEGFDDIDLEDLLGGMFGGAAARRGPDSGRRPGGRADADRRGGLPGWPPHHHPGRAGRAAQLRGEHPARGHRRPAHPAGRAGRPGARRRRRRRPLPGGPASRRIRATGSRAATSTSTCR